MHYIRFLKPPKLVSPPSPVLSAKITVTTDLGESFLFSDLVLVMELESQSGRKIPSLGDGKEYLWKGSDGMRSLEVSVPVPASKRSETMRVLIRPKENKHKMDYFKDMLHEATVLSEDYGRVMAVRSMDIDLSKTGQQGVGMARRVLSMRDKTVSICEETGESIARHIWYDWTGTSTISLLTNYVIGMLGLCFHHISLQSRQSPLQETFKTPYQNCHC
jgi:hypothetical protein